jgi:molybdenum cofactor guanylyltransferase
MWCNEKMLRPAVVQASQPAAHFPPISGIILAGGQSKRMGRDKALLPRPDPHPDNLQSSQNTPQMTFVQHQFALLTTCCQEVFIVARNQAQASDIGAHLAGSSMPTILTDDLIDRATDDLIERATARDRPYNDTNLHGPLVGLYSGLSAISTTHALVVAVDMPFIQPALLSFLLAQSLTNAILVPLVNNIPQVLLAIYPRSILPLIEARLQEGRRDPRSLLEVALVKTIDEAQLRLVDPQLRSFVNINTPEELDHPRP